MRLPPVVAEPGLFITVQNVRDNTRVHARIVRTTLEGYVVDAHGIEYRFAYKELTDAVGTYHRECIATPAVTTVTAKRKSATQAAIARGIAAGKMDRGKQK